MQLWNGIVIGRTDLETYSELMVAALVKVISKSLGGRPSDLGQLTVNWRTGWAKNIHWNDITLWEYVGPHGSSQVEKMIFQLSYTTLGVNMVIASSWSNPNSFILTLAGSFTVCQVPVYQDHLTYQCTSYKSESERMSV